VLQAKNYNLSSEFFIAAMPVGAVVPLMSFGNDKLVWKWL
jgi:hypothetical protein